MNQSIFGYITLYMKFTSKDSVYYAQFHSDFSKALTEPFFTMILDQVQNVYEQQYGQTLTGTFCTKEEYDAHDDHRMETHIAWETIENPETHITWETIENPDMLQNTSQWLYELVTKRDNISHVLFSTREEKAAIDGLQWFAPSSVYCVRTCYQNGQRIQEWYDQMQKNWRLLEQRNIHI